MQHFYFCLSGDLKERGSGLDACLSGDLEERDSGLDACLAGGLEECGCELDACWEECGCVLDASLMGSIFMSREPLMMNVYGSGVSISIMIWWTISCRCSGTSMSVRASSCSIVAFILFPSPVFAASIIPWMFFSSGGWI